MATILNAIGCFEIIGGFIAAIISADVFENILVPIVIMAGCFVNGIMFCAFGKGIELLEDMVSNQNKIIAKLIPDSEDNPNNDESDSVSETTD